MICISGLLSLTSKKRGPLYQRLVAAIGLLFVLSGCGEPTVEEPPAILNPDSVSIVDARIAVGSDDAEENPTSGAVSRSDATLELVSTSTGANQTVGLRFAGLSIPRGVTVTKAYVQFKAHSGASTATSISIFGQAADNAATFSSSTNNISLRPRTGASVPWAAAAWTTGAVGPEQQTADLTPIIQEIISRPGWNSGNAIALILTGSGRRVAKSFEGDPANAPLLHVEYVVDTPLSIDNFTASPGVAEINQAVTFSWSISGAQSSPLSCTLDVDSNGVAEYTIPDCRSTTTQTHAYAASSSYNATLTVNAGGGASASATAGVQVLAPELESVEARIAVGSDDAEENASGGVGRSDATLELVSTSTGANQTVGLRFAGLSIPRGVTVTKAYVQFKAHSGASTATSISIFGQAADNAATFTGTLSSISGRPRTGASVPWAAAAWTTGAVGPEQQTADLTPIIQEIISRPGWNSGNAIALILTGSGRRVAKSFEGDPANAPLLHVEYNTAEAPPHIDRFAVDSTSVVRGQSVTFSWSASDPGSRPLRCTLDVDSDTVIEYTIADCRNTRSQTHTYTVGGRYWPTLTAIDAANATDTTTLSLHVTRGESVTIATAGDIACDPFSGGDFNGGAGTTRNCHARYTSDVVLNLQPDAVITAGDHQYNDALFDKYLVSYDPAWGRFKSITYPAIGTHEYDNGNVAGYFAYFGAAAGDPTKGYYSFDLGSWHVVMLNSNCSRVGGCSSGSRQEKWLRADLAANPETCTLAVMKHPRYSSGEHGNMTIVTPLWQALYEAGAEIVLSGNDHVYERFAPQDAAGNLDPAQGIRQFTVGTGGKSLYAFGTTQPNSEAKQNTDYGVLKLVLHPTSYEWEFLPEQGKTFADSGTNTCH